ncbi:di/tricarboxylate transporter [Microvirga lupini]|uniref:Di/tricarboxylate transporter n=1 Tax=Microvirga lupini TaxID=420324 RepID=A0A7W4VQL1_9HYPH|nr:SLC13 family permease [Microvirga lupini]MBB3021504.1 di/tricarboxylate transporter [Microvirga lupini]
MSPITSIAVIIAAAVVLFIWNRLPVVVVAMGVALALWATQILTLEQALSGFGDSAVIFIACLFVVSTGLEATGVTAWAGQLLIRWAGEKSRTRLLLLTMGLVSLLTALISVNGAVAALLPVVVVMTVRLRRKSSQLLIPLVFSAHAGSMLALTGTPVNVLVSEAGLDAGVGGFGFFEFALVGIPLLAGTMAIIILFGEGLLPQRNGAKMPADLSRHARTLVEQYGLADGIFQMRVRADSPYVGLSPSDIDFSSFPGLHLVVAQEGESATPLRRPVAESDHLLVRGNAEAAASLAARMHLSFREDMTLDQSEETLFNRQSGLAEVVIPPRSGLIGQTMFPGMVTDSGDLIVLAVQRAGAEINTDAPKSGRGVALRAGDTLLLQGTWKALDVHLSDPDVLVVNSPELVRRQAVPLGPGAYQAIAVLVGMVILLATGLVPPAVAGLFAAGAIVLSRILTVEQSYHAIEWTTVILVGALMPLSLAMVETGTAQLMAEGLVDLVGDAGPYALLGGLFALTALLGQLISNTATALIVIPIGVAAAASMGISPRPVLMSTAVAAAGAFLTPIATPTNLMVMGPGGYAFSDYWKLGLPLLLWFFVVSVFLVPLIWRF